MKKLIRGFGFAFKGLGYAFATQLNFRIQVAMAFIVTTMGIYFNISHTEWLWLTLCIAIVLMMELFNTGIEALVDLVSPNYNPLAGHVKDISAAAVLIVAIFALVTGCVIFLPKILFLCHVA